MTSYRIWTPSTQSYIRMNEITCEQYRNILKSTEDSKNFTFYTDALIRDNLSDPMSSVAFSPTIIDKFIIILQLKVYSCNTNLNLSRECSKCRGKTDFVVDLNKLIDDLAPSVDRSFKQTIDIGEYSVTCDVPMMGKDSDTENLTDDQRIDRYLYSFINDISIYSDKLLLPTRSDAEKFRICQSLPYKVTYAIKKQYVDGIHEVFKNLLLLKTKCSDKSCGDELEIKFDVLNIDDIIKILFRDNNNVNMLQQYATVSKNCYFDYNFYKNICPAELETVYNMVVEGSKSDNQEQNTNQDIDLFQEYRAQTKGMVETESEFG